MDTKIKMTRIDAVRVYDCIKNMTGSPSYQLLRQEVNNRIEKLWPEILVQDSPTEPGITRDLMLSSREQRGLAEGFVVLFNKKDAAGEFVLTSVSFSLVQEACKVCKVWNWVKSKIEQEEIVDFDGDLDDDLPISDEAPVVSGEELVTPKENKKKRR